jgi:hypothetical protein
LVANDEISEVRDIVGNNFGFGGEHALVAALLHVRLTELLDPLGDRLKTLHGVV